MGEKLAINRWAEEDRPREKMVIMEWLHFLMPNY